MASKKNKRTRNAGDKGLNKGSKKNSAKTSSSGSSGQQSSNTLDMTQAAEGYQGSDDKPASAAAVARPGKPAAANKGGTDKAGANHATGNDSSGSQATRNAGHAGGGHAGGGRGNGGHGSSGNPGSAGGGGGDGSITTVHVDMKRRRMLVTGATVVGGLGAAALAAPMVASMSPSARAKAAGAPVEADISKLEPGRSMTVEWRGKPVWMVSRTPEALASLAKVADSLSDPDCEVPQQPEYAKNETRSIKPEILVMVGICTHLGCSPTYRPEIAPADLGADWLGGFFCPCHGSKFDLSGRVYAGVPAPTNLEVPPHHYLNDSLILIGVGPEGAAA